MFDSSLATITMFFVVIGVCLIFIITWIIKSEARINVCKNEIKKLKGDLDTSERERFVLAEKIANFETASPAADPHAEEEISALKEENGSLRKELSEAKASLEEVYKALS